MKRVWLLAMNDLRLTARDRPAAIWMLLMPIAMMWFFGGMGGGGASAPPVISLGLVNHDDGWLATALVEELEDERLRFHEMQPDEYAGAEDKVRTLVIPAGFTAQVLAGSPQTLRLEKEPNSSASFGMAAEVHINRAIVRTLGRLVEMGESGELDLDRFRTLSERPELVTVAVAFAGAGRAVPDGRQQSVPGMITFLVLMMTSIYGGVFLTIEKASGMLERQALLPLSRGQIFAGKLLGRMLMAGAQVTVLILVGRFVFGVSLGRSPLAMLALLVAYTFAVAGLATLLGAVLRTPAQASSVGWIVAMVMAAMGGCWWPSEVMPDWLRQVAHTMPTAWAMDAFHALISFGQGFEAVALPIAALVGFGAAYSVLGARFLQFER